MKIKAILFTLLTGILVVLSACGAQGETYELQVSASVSSITISVTEGKDDTGNSYILEAPTAEGYEFSHWNNETTNSNVGSTNPLSITLTENTVIEAVYTEVTVVEDYTITVSSNVTDGEPAITQNGNDVTLTATTVDGYTFTHYIDSITEQVLSTSLSYSFTLTENTSVEAIYTEDSVTIYTITLSASISGDHISFTKDENTVSITANDVDGYTFLHWKDTSDSSIYSTNASLTITLTENMALQAVYESDGTTGVTLFYETGFEDGSKSAYAEDTLVLSSQTWTFYDALIGDLETDLDVSGNSVRIRNGYIETGFTVTNLAEIVFYAGTYGSDDAHTLRLEISLDANTWVVVDSFTTTQTMTEYDYIFDDTMYSDLSLSSSSPYYIRIVSETDERANIDDVEIYTGDGGAVVSDAPLYTITLDSGFQYDYLIGDIVDVSGCTATHPTNGETTCDVDGVVNTHTAGTYDITFSKTDEFNNTVSITVSITILDVSSDLLSMDLMSYYDDAEGLYGQALIDALNTILNDTFYGRTYGEARYILDETDEDPNNASNLILVYLGTSVNGAWDSGVTWNREHLWPQSLLGVSADNGTVNMASDLYNLMPANPSENSSRGNTPYGDMGLGYEPRDDIKGDIARALFYMMIMYDELDLVNTTPGVHEMGYLDILLQWHYDDPVDDFERHRMDVIISYQSNRNPFVDYPHFVELIWSYNPS